MKYFPRLWFYVCLAASAVFPLGVSAQSNSAYVSMNSFVAPDQRVSPMPPAERVRRGAVPKRGMCSTVPATREDNGLLSGNGKMWVEVFGDPFSEQIMFNEENLIQPWKSKPLEAPKIAYVLRRYEN